MPMSQGVSRPQGKGSALPMWLRAIDLPLLVVESIFRYLAIAALVLLVLNTGVNAALRNVLSVQIPGSQNMTILYFLPAIVFLGLTRVQAKDTHISATLVTERLGRNAQRYCKIVSNVLIVFVSYLMFAGAWTELLRVWGSSLGGSPDLPVGPSWLFVPLGFAIIMIRALQQTMVHAFYPSAIEALESASMSGERPGDEVA